MKNKHGKGSKAVLAGNDLVASRLMRDLDDQIPSAKRSMKALFAQTGRAHIIGITGSPGTGKSTLVDKLITVARERGLLVGVVAVDPTSPFTQGAVLGDRVRMQRHSTDAGVFIRSVATRGHLGGLSRSTYDIVDVMDAMGKNLIIVETVGTGQGEVDVMRLAHTTIVVQVPGLGDETQAIKAGILEIGDIFVVNKADLKGADKTVSDLESMLSFKTRSAENWTPIVLKTQANTAMGITELMDQIDRHRKYLRKNRWKLTQAQRNRDRFLGILRNSLLVLAEKRLYQDNKWQSLIRDVENRVIDPYSAVDKVLDELFFFISDKKHF